MDSATPWKFSANVVVEDELGDEGALAAARFALNDGDDGAVDRGDDLLFVALDFELGFGH